MNEYNYLLYVILIVLTSLVIPRLPSNIIRILNRPVSRGILLILIPLTIILDPVIGLLLTILFVSIVYMRNQQKISVVSRKITDLSSELQPQLRIQHKKHEYEQEFSENVHPYVPRPGMGTNELTLDEEPALWKTV